MSRSQRQHLVLTAPTHAPCLNATLVDTVTRLLARDAVVDARWLAPGEAWELTFAAQGDGGAHLKQQIATALIGFPVDINILPYEGSKRRKKLLVADMDSTIIEQECIDEIADFAEVRAEVAAITERAMAGELDFEAALKARVALLKDLPANIVEAVLVDRITVMPGALDLVRTMKEHGARTALVSGGFTVFTSQVAAMVGFDTHHGNELIMADGKLGGTVAEPILGRQAKLDTLQAEAASVGISLGDTLAVGDGANDLAMLGAAGLGVAYRAKPIVAAAARASITHADLRALLYLQGYARDEFAE
ncbi:MAG: phosphoserine phosphatase SerB [Hyphomicrobiaceae bacterium]|nr:phosphoserine phosphatase SerB [Hyphomicrobiaceae bacterium]